MAYKGFYTDNLGDIFEWTCPYVPTPDDPKAELDERVIIPYGSVSAEWMEYLIGFQFGSGLLSVFGLPVYVVLASIGWGYYNVINFIGLEYYWKVQWLDLPVDGTLEEDKKVYTLANYVDYPLRKMWLYEMLIVMGVFCAIFPVTNLWTMPVLGLAAFYNELF